jgi:outer membrane murein-binding lipoprotein Lpp
MSSARIIVAAAAAAGALLAGSALAQEAKKDQPRAQGQERHARGEHRGHGMKGMSAMSGMREGCHGAQAQAESGEHKHE